MHAAPAHQLACGSKPHPVQPTFGFTASPMTDPWLITIQTLRSEMRSGWRKPWCLPEWEVQPACKGWCFPLRLQWSSHDHLVGMISHRLGRARPAGCIPCSVSRPSSKSKSPSALYINNAVQYNGTGPDVHIKHAAAPGPDTLDITDVPAHCGGATAAAVPHGT
jgi:hypothetical protein